MNVEHESGQPEMQGFKEPDMIVDWMRHGKPEYSDAEEASLQLEGKLTQTGIEMTKKEAEELANEIDPDQEEVILWISPKNRAQETAKIVEEKLLSKGINILHLNRPRASHTRQALRDTHYSPDFELTDEEWNDWMRAWVDKEDLPKGTETPAEVDKRVRDVVTYLERISRKVKPESGKKLHPVLLTHEEDFRPLLEEGFGTGTDKGTGPTYAERIKMGIHSTRDDQNATLDISFRGQDAKLSLDINSRKFKRVALQ